MSVCLFSIAPALRLQYGRIRWVIDIVWVSPSGVGGLPTSSANRNRLGPLLLQPYVAPRAIFSAIKEPLQDGEDERIEPLCAAVFDICGDGAAASIFVARKGAASCPCHPERQGVGPMLFEGEIERIAEIVEHIESHPFPRGLIRHVTAGPRLRIGWRGICS